MTSTWEVAQHRAMDKIKEMERTSSIKTKTLQAIQVGLLMEKKKLAKSPVEMIQASDLKIITMRISFDYI